MIIRIWGARGSSPTPLSPHEIREKIEAVIHLVNPTDLVSEATKQRFISSLSNDVCGTTGGNTVCIEVRTNDGEVILLDTGTGLREFEKSIIRNGEKIDEYHIFLSHFHYDHLLGIPYFSTMYNPSAKVHFYSPYPEMEHVLAKFMEEPFHPVGWDSFTAGIDFHIMKEDEPVEISAAKVSCMRRTHPGGAFSYKVTENGRSFIYSSDTQLTEKDFTRNSKNNAYFQGAEVIVLDAQYTLDEAIAKYDWGHSSYSLAVQFAREYEIEKLLLFHHDPLNSDQKLAGILQAAISFNERLNQTHSNDMEIILAGEGYEIEL